MVIWGLESLIWNAKCHHDISTLSEKLVIPTSLLASTTLPAQLFNMT